MMGVQSPVAKILRSAWFQIAVVPLFLMLIEIFAKRLGRRAGDTSPARNDFAVGTTILLMLFGIAVGDVGRAASDPAELVAFLGFLVVVACVLFVSMEHDRFRSWERDAQGLPTRKNACSGGWFSRTSWDW
jgi:hypothetical protein